MFFSSKSEKGAITTQLRAISFARPKESPLGRILHPSLDILRSYSFDPLRNGLRDLDENREENWEMHYIACGFAFCEQKKNIQIIPQLNYML